MGKTQKGTHMYVWLIRLAHSKTFVFGSSGQFFHSGRGRKLISHQKKKVERKQRGKYLIHSGNIHRHTHSNSSRRSRTTHSLQALTEKLVEGEMTKRAGETFYWFSPPLVRFVVIFCFDLLLALRLSFLNTKQRNHFDRRPSLLIFSPKHTNVYLRSVNNFLRKYRKSESARREANSSSVSIALFTERCCKFQLLFVVRMYRSRAKLPTTPPVPFADLTTFTGKGLNWNFQSIWKNEENE